ncbi:hypothetical protein OMO38_02080 [Chryseobacterium sp. 09-1422]|uniref:Uncharacterized protein n=1 Tax=Chryseobacterium kimseyorum TaxID=2984028 RepID=A0ABT3HU43_9FLAO|nr:hypothetical protein [Chryseobacterium kimseyorum]MCW3167306.1 hypothetical protein [Chryseobacterium kimseyorum]
MNLTQPDLSGALFVIAIAEKFNLLTQFLRNDKKAGTEGGKAAQNILVKRNETEHNARSQDIN